MQIYRPSQFLLNNPNPTKRHRVDDLVFDLESPQRSNYGRTVEDDGVKQVQRVIHVHRPSQPQLIDTRLDTSLDDMFQPTSFHRHNQSQDSFLTQVMDQGSNIKVYQPSTMAKPKPQRIRNDSSEDSDELPDQQRANAHKKHRYTPKQLVEFNYERNFRQFNNLGDIVSP